jgi:HEAT repeat protein
MTNKNIATMTVAAGAAVMAGAKALADEKVKVDAAAVDQAFETLKTYDWGVDRKVMKPIDQAIIATHGDAAARKALEKRLVDTLNSDISRSAQDFVCRALRTVGTAQSVDALAALLPAEETSHIARYALERIPDDAAGKALRDALPKVNAKLKTGIMGSLGSRGDEDSLKALYKLLKDDDILVSKHAAQSLGLIGTSKAAKALSKYAKKAPANMRIPIADACLSCAEQLLADGDKSKATALYKDLKADATMPKHVTVAAVKGMLAAAARK